LIKRSHELKRQVNKEFLGGKGQVELTHFLDKEDAAGTGRLFSISMLTPGSSIGFHVHNGDFENYYILKGKAMVTEDDGSKHYLEAGDVMFTPNGSGHAIENVGEDNLEYIALILFD
jgi:quercetin dioxygenase-like cupin family protein